MSATYGWMPDNPPPPIAGVFGLDMADILLHHQTGETERADRYDLRGTELDRDEVMWLRGVAETARHVGARELLTDAEELIEAILKHGSIILVVER